MFKSKRFKRHIIVKIYVPLVSEGSQDLSEDISKAMSNRNLRKLFNVIKKYDFVGRMGEYSGVFEIQYGYEGYIPGERSNPTHGYLGEESILHSMCLTTFLPDSCSEEEIIKFLKELAEQHPWEHPVIEILSSDGIFLWDPIIT